VEIREVHGHEALARWVEVRNPLFPFDPDSVQVLALSRAREPGHVNLLALLDDEPVGVAMIGDDPGTRASTHAFVEVGVVPEHRGRGIGTALFRDVSLRVMTRGHEGLECEALASDARTLDWLTRRGFRELRRHPQLVLEAEDPLADAPLPRGVAGHAVGSRPDLIQGMFEVARASYADYPSPRSGQAATYTDWQVYELGADAIDVDLSLVAERDGSVLGYSIVIAPPSTDEARHKMTCVLPTAGDELAAALVREVVVRARGAGRRRVVAWALTPAMEDVFSRLGFRPGDETVMLQGPLL
jgi:ribosomal protein S18 acetylase RimI-like enzyme